MRSDEVPLASSIACDYCHQSKFVDSLTGRCVSCEPIQIGEFPAQFQPYVRHAQSKKSREFFVGLLLGPVLIAVYFFYAFSEGDAPAWLLWLLLIGTPILMGATFYNFKLKRSLLQRYYRLAYAMHHVKPVEAELQYEIKGRNRHYVKVCQLDPSSKWPGGMSQKIQIDMPPQSGVQTVTNDFWKTLVAGYNPHDHPKLWGRIYFDPDRSGNAVVCVKDALFLSLSENNKSL